MPTGFTVRLKEMVLYQCHLAKPRNLAKQDATISQQLGLDIFKKRLAETRAAQKST